MPVVNSRQEARRDGILVLLATLVFCLPLYANTGDDDATLAASKTPNNSYHRQVEKLESEEGAYSSALAEQLLSLGLSLQSNGSHEQAVGAFKRGVHLTRINNGLYSADQIPLLQGEITSHIALGQYAEADERQHYLYRVQVRSMVSGLSRAQAFVQQADWQYNAYMLGVEGHGFSRLMSIWDLNRLALTDISEREGSTSTNLLPPLHGMLRAQYLIAGYEGDGQSSSNSSESMAAQQDKNRFFAYRSQSYKRGQSVILAIYDIEEANHGAKSTATANVLTMLGDWRLWYGEREAAMQAYQDAIAELVEHDDAQTETDRMLGEPVALPDLDGVRPLPEAVAAENANTVLQFNITERGRVEELERTDDYEENSGAVNRLMRKLRKTRFRPRFEMGEPVESVNIVKAYDIQ